MISYVAIRTGRWRTDERHVSRRLKKHTSVLGLADRIFVYQHYDLALCNVALRFREFVAKKNNLQSQPTRSWSDLWPRESAGRIAQRRRFLFGQTRSDGPCSAVRITTHVEDYRGRVFDRLEHFVDFARLQTVEINIAITARQHLNDWRRSFQQPEPTSDPLSISDRGSSTSRTSPTRSRTFNFTTLSFGPSSKRK